MMKRAVFLITVLGILLAAVPAVAAPGEVYISSEYLTDSDGYNYGVVFFANSTVNVPIYVKAYIEEQRNVNGDVVYGNVLMQAFEKRVKIGTFSQRDPKQGWYVRVNAKWTEAVNQ